MDTALLFATFIVAFLLAFWTYRRGLKDGLAINNGAKTIEPVKTPAASFKEYVEQREAGKTQDDFMKAAMGILTYDEDEAGDKT